MNNRNTLWFVTGLLALLALGGIVINQRVTAQKEAESAARRSEIRAQMLQAQLTQQQAEKQRAILALQAQAQRQTVAREAAQLQAAQRRNLQAIQRITAPPPMRPMVPMYRPSVVVQPPRQPSTPSLPAARSGSGNGPLTQGQWESIRQQAEWRDVQDRATARQLMQHGGGSSVSDVPGWTIVDIPPPGARQRRYPTGRGYTAPGVGAGSGGVIHRR